MATCRDCGSYIFWARDPRTQRFVPCSLRSVRGDEQPDSDGVVERQPFHRRHLCGEPVPELPPAPTPPAVRARVPPPPRVGVGWTSSASYSETARPRTPRQVLFVTEDAPPEVVRAAFRALAMLYHPDRGGDLRRMQELTDAWVAIKDTIERDVAR